MYNLLTSFVFLPGWTTSTGITGLFHWNTQLDTEEEMHSQFIGGKSSVSYGKVGDNLFSLTRNALGKIFIEMNYLLGRHRNLGDKFKVIVIKK
jgi:hypothetical protein